MTDKNECGGILLFCGIKNNRLRCKYRKMFTNVWHSFSHTEKHALHMLLLCDLGPQVLYYFGTVRVLFKKGLPIILFHTSYWSVWSRTASAADGWQPPTASCWIPAIRFFHSGQPSVTHTVFPPCCPV